MARRDREPLRPEDATSFEEFQARCVVEQAQIRAINSSWKDIGRMILSGFVALGAILFWVGVAADHDAGRWFLLLFALICTGLLVWLFGKIERRGVRGSKRYRQLDRLSKEWQAKAERGEIPQTTPGGPKVWPNEVEAETQGR